MRDARSQMKVSEYVPRPSNFSSPASRRTCSCCRIFGLMFRLLGYSVESSSSNRYASSSVNLDRGSLRRCVSNTLDQLRLLSGCTARFSVALNLARQMDLGTASPFSISEMRPSSGIWSRRMLQPVQPALRAVSARGGRFWMTSRVIKE